MAEEEQKPCDEEDESESERPKIDVLGEVAMKNAYNISHNVQAHILEDLSIIVQNNKFYRIFCTSEVLGGLESQKLLRKKGDEQFFGGFVVCVF